MRAAFRLRLRIIGIALALCAVLFIGRLYVVQIIQGEEYAMRADRQYVHESHSPYNRGKIYFTRKDGTPFEAASLSSGFLIAINPSRLKDPEAAYAAIAAQVPVTRESFMAQAAKKDDPYEEVARKVSLEAGRAIAEQEIPGVLVVRERWRSYPLNEAGAQSIGFVSYGTGDQLVGQYGLERYYNDTLERSPGLFKNFFAELFSNVGDIVIDARSVREGHLNTSIEPVVQEQLRDVLLAVADKYSSAEVGGIIMDPSTGEIVALDTVPTFNPNNRNGVSPELFGNPLAENVYEFGSIVKALTVAVGFDAGVVTPSSTYTDTGCTVIDTARICNYDGKARGPGTTMQLILSNSLNLGVAHIAKLLGHDRMRSYFLGLGFGKETGIDLPGEVRGMVRNLESPRDVEYATASFGQGIATTPVAMIRALGALANGGKIVTPHIATGVRLSSGINKTFAWAPAEQVLSPKAVEDTTRILVEVVDTALAGGKAKIPEMSVAAKTGTAQMANPTGGYEEDRYFHSFFGYFPAYNPKFIILLYTKDPRGVQYASETLTQPFMDLARFLVHYYDIPPDRAYEQSQS